MGPNHTWALFCGSDNHPPDWVSVGSPFCQGPLGLCSSKWQHPGSLLEMLNLRPQTYWVRTCILTRTHTHIKVWETLVYHAPKNNLHGHFVLGSVFHYACQTWQWSPCLSEPHRNGALLKNIVFVVLVMFSFYFSDLQLTGIILRAAKRFQINVYVEKRDGFM